MMKVSKRFRFDHTTDVRRRRVVFTGFAAAVGLLTLPFLPRGSDLNPDDLLKPELAQANPALMRELVLEFHDHPKVDYRLAAAVMMAGFKDTQVQGILFNKIATEQMVTVKKALAESLAAQRDPATYPRLAQLYWAEPEIRASVDSVAMLLDVSALRTAIQQAQP